MNIIGILTFPQFPDISKEAISLAQSLDKNAPKPVIGGAKIEFIKKYFGWKTARYLHGTIYKKTNRLELKNDRFDIFLCKTLQPGRRDCKEFYKF